MAPTVLFERIPRSTVFRLDDDSGEDVDLVIRCVSCLFFDDHVLRTKEKYATAATSLEIHSFMGIQTLRYS